MTIAFGEYQLHEGLYELRRAGAVVPLPPKAFDLLAYLLRHRDRVVTKSELLAKVWPSEAVTGSSLTSCMKTLRDRLADDPDARDLIETVRGRGYRFSGHVQSPIAGASTAREPLLDARRPSFVGRRSELARLDEALAQSLGGQGRAVLVSGDGGIGKTRLVEELCALATDVATVVVGAAREGEGVPAFWPWVESLHTIVDGVDDATLRVLVGAGAAELAELVPAIGARLADVPPTPAPTAEHARVRLFDSIRRFLAAAAARRPIVLVLEDLHLADRSSLLLLEFLARHISRLPLLVVATYRGTEIDPDHLLVSVTCTLRRDAACTRLQLHGLDVSDVRDLMEGRLGARVSDTLLAAIVRATEGNPLYVIEMQDHLAEEGTLDGRADLDLTVLGVPDGIRQVIGRRLARLPIDCVETLQVAAVLGRTFAFDALAHVSRASRERLVAHLDAAVTAGVLVAGPLETHRFAFSHALIRETLYQGLPTLERVRLHQRVGRSLARLYGDDDARAAELAHHFLAAGPLGDPSQAVAYARRAGDRAAAALAYEDAESHYQRALAALPATPRGASSERGRLLVALAEAQSRSGRTGAGHEAFRDAATIARAAGDLELLVQATLGLGGRHLRLFGSVDRGAVTILEETLPIVGDGSPRLRAALQARLAMALRHDPASLPRRCALAEHAVALARGLDDVPLLASVLDDVLWGLWRPDNLDERRVIARELVELSRRAGDPELELRAHGWCIVTQLEAGDLQAVDTAIREHARLGESLRLHPYRWDVLHYRAMRALMEGRFDDAERLADEGYAGRDYRPPHNADLVYGTQVGLIRVLQGRGVEVIPMIESLLDRHPTTWHAALAWIEVHVGRLDDARRRLTTLAAHDFDDLPADSVWLVSHAFLAVVSHATGDARCARLLYERLLPFRDHLVVVSEYGLACLGSVHHYVALAAAAMRRLDDACAHFERADDVHRALGAGPQIAMTCVELARCLRERDAPGDRARAHALLAEATTTAARLGMHELASRAQRSAAPDGDFAPRGRSATVRPRC